jgi:adenine-specific DNA-methyltransferase
LERELDFYLKNEVLNLDELEAGGEARSAAWFQTMRAIKEIGRKIIEFVAQIENFQKRLFEKKKFVTEVNYCVTLDRVPEELYPEIAKNKAQIEEWKRLFHIHEIERDTTHPGFKEPVKVDFLKANPFLILDTAFFDSSFTDRLLADSENLVAMQMASLFVRKISKHFLCWDKSSLKMRMSFTSTHRTTRRNSVSSTRTTTSIRLG